ncbi:MAG TPA: glutamate racemase [Thermoanaerobacterales bacterium]|nr:glutamate racemase [Thermoanaerobacterales bacterium]
MTDVNRPIGVFDSGIGGLTVVKELMDKLPNEEIIYLGDTARVPYGTKSKETITRYSLECAEFLTNKNVKMLITACNTISASSLDELEASFPVPILGVIIPGAKAAVEATKLNQIGVIGTERTISSNAYTDVIKKINEEIKTHQKPCPLFVHLAEEGWHDIEVTHLTAIEYLADFKLKGIDTLVLGCTHYPLLENVIQRVVGRKVKLINPANETARTAKEILEEKNLRRTADTQPTHQFYVTDNPEKFIQVGEKFLDKEIRNIEKVDITRI